MKYAFMGGSCNIQLLYIFLSGMQDERKDLSHPVHSDNCYLNETLGECIKQPPAFTWRDYRLIYQGYIITGVRPEWSNYTLLNTNSVV